MFDTEKAFERKSIEFIVAESRSKALRHFASRIKLIDFFSFAYWHLSKTFLWCEWKQHLHRFISRILSFILRFLFGDIFKPRVGGKEDDESFCFTRNFIIYRYSVSVSKKEAGKHDNETDNGTSVVRVDFHRKFPMQFDSIMEHGSEHSMQSRSLVVGVEAASSTRLKNFCSNFPLKRGNFSEFVN